MHMTRALELAHFQHGRTGVNPSVGCVILDRDGNKVSEAATGDEGRPHAEQTALRRMPIGAAAGGTAYVTLEPCRERSTGEAACSQRLIEAGVERVIIAALDPHPKGSGGLNRLREAGIKIETGLMKADAEKLYADFFASVG
jgi:pyrimidine deaminase RibD-like protein